MNHGFRIFLYSSFILLLYLAAGCSSRYAVTGSTGKMIVVDSTWDIQGNEGISSIVASYQYKVDSVMNLSIGHSQSRLDVFQPESPLSNLTTDMIRHTAARILGKDADMAVTNLGGMRTSLPAGVITLGNAFEIFPFDDNQIVVTWLRGKHVKTLLQQIAHRGGEGISGVHMHITTQGDLKDFSITGKVFHPDSLYSVATINYVAEGNDGMGAFRQAEKVQDVPNGNIRDVFIDYIQELERNNLAVSARCDGRITIVKP